MSAPLESLPLATVLENTRCLKRRADRLIARKRDEKQQEINAETNHEPAAKGGA